MSIKKQIVSMLAIAIAAVIVYFWAINLIDTSCWCNPQPDYIGTISTQPDFTNTVRSW